MSLVWELTQSGVHCVHLSCLWLTEAGAVTHSAQLNSMWDSGVWRDSSPLPVCYCGWGAWRMGQADSGNQNPNLRTPYLFWGWFVCLPHTVPWAQPEYLLFFPYESSAKYRQNEAVTWVGGRRIVVYLSISAVLLGSNDDILKEPSTRSEIFEHALCTT